MKRMAPPSPAVKPSAGCFAKQKSSGAATPLQAHKKRPEEAAFPSEAAGSGFCGLLQTFQKKKKNLIYTQRLGLDKAFMVED